MMVERFRWERVDDDRLPALGEGSIVRIMVRKRPVAFVRIGGALRAMVDRCPHQGSSLSGGWVDDGHVVCPFHRFHYDPATGRCRHGLTTNVEIFPVQEDAEGVRLGFAYTTIRIFGIDLW
ncbi:MAG: Rieske (2Fe-2S) protein [Flavobacteriales bacterium]